MPFPHAIPGLHHVTAISGPPQANVDFYIDALRQRLVKKTVNFDAPGTLTTSTTVTGPARRAFLSMHSAVHNKFDLQRHLISRRTLRLFRVEAAIQRQLATAAAWLDEMASLIPA